MKLSDLLGKAGVTPLGSLGDAEIDSISLDSRKVGPGTLFVCMPSRNSDSHSYLASAAQNGAVAAIVYEVRGMGLAQKAGLAAVLLSNEGLDYNEALWQICRALFDSPSRDMKVVGVTGTNGKTTTAWLIRDMLVALGERAAYLGTLGIQLPGEERELSNTTPFAVELYSLLGELRAKDVGALAVEVSSHALSERRSDGVEFDAGVFTNLTQDHLDFHGTMESYGRAKHRLFSQLPKQTEKRFVAAFNIDDPIGLRWSLEQDGPTVTYGLQGDADLRGTAVQVKVDRIRMRLEYRGEIEVAIPLGGNFNVSNCLSASAGMLALGYDLGTIKEALPQVRPVPGRFEAVPNNKGIGILVDYAHTADALEKLLDSVRELQPNRIVTVFGCGGDRDRTKRPKMALAASERSDLTVVTSDNPRSEDPAEILAEVTKGIVPGKESVAIIDRREAIEYAVRAARPGDVVVIAGKGHENYQIIGRTKYPMDDRLMAAEALS
ncbi:MAG: UDP-N-acetylmuramoyl-L-alanyl-D-glutamate--2,6-diaminopimelate ligase [Fimbriimonas sp.]|nr:UDP-N-acetylmuramoyl-L-alanyl-D-glutamate--2,6-diaminopimelate ligase [Fimbriimonas sp.]